MRYFSKIADPVHVPRPQLVVLNLLRRDENYVPPPRSVVSVRYGKDPPEPDYSNPDKIRRADCNNLINEEEFLVGFPLRVVDKPAKYLWESLRALVWHISPVGPRVLHLLGLPTEQAWSFNRTKIVARLGEMGEEQFARDYARFYLSGWQYFLSRYSDTDAGRSSLIAGVKALGRGVEIARSWSSRNSSASKNNLSP